MNTYRIYSKSGNDWGLWEGETEAHALASMHQDAGYKVSTDGEKLRFESESDRELCGDLGDWVIEEEAVLGKKNGFDLEMEAVGEQLTAQWEREDAEGI